MNESAPATPATPAEKPVMTAEASQAKTSFAEKGPHPIDAVVNPGGPATDHPDAKAAAGPRTASVMGSQIDRLINLFKDGFQVADVPAALAVASDVLQKSLDFLKDLGVLKGQVAMSAVPRFCAAGRTKAEEPAEVLLEELKCHRDIEAADPTPEHNALLASSLAHAAAAAVERLGGSPPA